MNDKETLEQRIENFYGKSEKDKILTDKGPIYNRTRKDGVRPELWF